MAAERVVRLTAQHIPALVTRLGGYGAYSVQTRGLLRLLQTRVNTAPFQLFAAGDEAAGPVTLTVTWPVPGLAVLDVCGREDAAGRRRLATLLRSPDLAELWRRPLRVEAISEGLGSVFSAAAADIGLKQLVPRDGDSQRLFARPEGLPCPPRQERPGLAVRPLLPRHLTRMEQAYPYSADSMYEDTRSILRDSQAAGLSAGVFLTEAPAAAPNPSPDPSPDGPVSWALVRSSGAQGFGYTEEAYRGRVLQSMVLTELIHLSLQRDLPVFGHTTDTNDGQLLNMQRLGFEPEHMAQWMYFVPRDHEGEVTK